MIIAVPTGIKIWASVREYMEFLSTLIDSKRPAEGYNTYPNQGSKPDLSVRTRGPKPVLKVAMRRTVESECRYFKIGYQTNGHDWMRLNCQSSSNFGRNIAGPWTRHLHGSPRTHGVKIYPMGGRNMRTLPIALGTDYKRTSNHVKSSVIYSTGEISYSGDGRGPVVLNQLRKGP